MEEGQYDAIILAAAGLRRLGWDDKIRQYLPADVSIPAIGQGALGIEIRSDDERTREGWWRSWTTGRRLWRSGRSAVS